MLGKIICSSKSSLFLIYYKKLDFLAPEKCYSPVPTKWTLLLSQNQLLRYHRYIKIRANYLYFQSYSDLKCNRSIDYMTKWIELCRRLHNRLYNVLESMKFSINKFLNKDHLIILHIYIEEI